MTIRTLSSSTEEAITTISPATGCRLYSFFAGVYADYHKPTDTIDKILFPRMERIVRLIHTTGWQIANAKTGLAKNVGSSMFSK